MLMLLIRSFLVISNGFRAVYVHFIPQKDIIKHELVYQDQIHNLMALPMGIKKYINGLTNQGKKELYKL